jgi:hypothetical protein
MELKLEFVCILTSLYYDDQAFVFYERIIYTLEHHSKSSRIRIMHVCCVPDAFELLSLYVHVCMKNTKNNIPQSSSVWLAVQAVFVCLFVVVCLIVISRSISVIRELSRDSQQRVIACNTCDRACYDSSNEHAIKLCMLSLFD